MASIQLHGVSVNFPVYDASSRSLKKNMLGSHTGGTIGAGAAGSSGTLITALEDVNLSFADGDRVALIGHNGAGKTTLLRTIAGIYEPFIGQVRVKGQIAPLFDITLGMDNESSGYDNIRLRGLFLGMSRQEIRSRLDEIAEFTELGEFLNMPIRTYSAGMRIRLAFAIVTSIEPDILLLDEGIGAGDSAFMKKASKRLSSFTERAAIIILASHSESLIREMCDSAIIFEHGRAVASGSVDQMIAKYNEVSVAPLR